MSERTKIRLCVAGLVACFLAAGLVEGMEPREPGSGPGRTYVDLRTGTLHDIGSDSDR